jgi:hypothetical protein
MDGRFQRLSQGCEVPCTSSYPSLLYLTYGKGGIE